MSLAYETPAQAQAKRDALERELKQKFGTGIIGTVTPNVGGIPQLNGSNITENGIYFIGQGGDYGDQTGVTLANKIVLLDVSNIETSATYSLIEYDVSIVKDATPTEGSTAAVESGGIKAYVDKGLIINVDVIDGGIDPTNGLTTSGGDKTTQLRSLELLEEIKVIGANTFTSGQLNLHWFIKIDDETYNNVASVNRTGDFTILKADFVATATHYALTAIPVISPNFAVTELINNKLFTDSEIKRVEGYINDDDFNERDYNLRVSITDASGYQNSKNVNLLTGRVVSTGNASNNISDLAEVELNKTYKKAFFLELFTYDKDKNYLGRRNDLIVDNSEFTIPTNVDTGDAEADAITNANNAKIKYVRIQSPNTDNFVLKEYTINSPAGLVYPAYNEKKVYNFKNEYKLPIQGFGDSIIGRHLDNIAQYSGRTFVRYTYGGCTSGLIRKQFFELANTENAIQFIYIGHNNVGELDTVIDDTQAMTDFLGHQRFLVASAPLGHYGSLVSTQETLAKMKLIENRLEGIYGKNYLNMRKAVVDGYPMGNVKLTQSFVQPPADGTTTVNIYIDKFDFMTFVNTNYDAQNWIPNQNLFKIGVDGVYDEYEIVSSTLVSGNSGYLTCKLVAAGSYRVAPGATVDNISRTQTPAGTSTPISFTRYLKVAKSADLYMQSLEVSPASFNEDGVHPSPFGGDYSSKIIAMRINSLNRY